MGFHDRHVGDRHGLVVVEIALVHLAAGYQVGYASPSQFSREFKRLFGAPPSEDIRRDQPNGDIRGTG